MKRIISLVLCLSMLLSMVPVRAFAEEVAEDVTVETTAATEAPQAESTEAEPEEVVSTEDTAPVETTTGETEATAETTTVSDAEETAPATEPEETLTASQPESMASSAMTGEELLEAIAAAGGWYVLQEAVVIDSDITLPQGTSLQVYHPATLTVTNGAELTVEGTLGVANGGMMTVEEDATVTIDDTFLIGGGSEVTVDGTLINNYRLDINYGALIVNGTYTVSDSASSVVDFYGSISGEGIDKSLFGIYTYVWDEASLLDSLILREGYAYQNVYAINYDLTGDNVLDPIVLTQSITIPEEIDFQIGRFTGESARLQLANGITVTNDGIFQLTSDGQLTVGHDCTLVNNGTLSNRGSILCFGEYEENGTYFNISPEMPAYITQEELLDAMAEDGSSEYTTDAMVLVTEDLTIPAGEYVTITNPGCMIVTYGTTLTVDGSLSFPGSGLTVQGGGNLELKGEGNLAFYGGSTLTIEKDATYSVPDTATIYADIGTTLTGITKGEVCNSNFLEDPEQNLQEVAEALGEGYKRFYLEILTDYTVDEDMTIPANVVLRHYARTVTVTNGATLTVNGDWEVGTYVPEEGIGDVPGHIEVKNGTLDIKGTLDLLYGSTLKVAEGSGTVTGTVNGTVESYVPPMTADDLLAAMEEALETQTWYDLTREVIIDSDITLPEECALTVCAGGKITVTDGATLTFGHMYLNGGSVEAQAGGKLYALRSIFAETGSLTIADPSCYEGDYDFITVYSTANVSGFTPDLIHYSAMVNTEAELRSAMENEAGYPQVQAIIMSSITLAEDLTVPEDFYMAVGVNPFDLGVGEIEPSVFLTVPRGVTLTNEGQIGINLTGYMTVAEGGTLVNRNMFIHAFGLTVNGTHIEDPIGEYGMECAVIYGRNAVRPENNLTQEELEAAIANGEDADLPGKYIDITGDLTLDTGLYYDQNTIITVKSGATLTLTETSTCYGASLYVENGGTLKLTNSAMLHVTWGILSIADGGALILEDGSGIVASEDSAILKNVSNSQRINTFYVSDEAGLLEAIHQTTYAGADIWITEFATIELTDDLTIPENVTIRMLNSNTLRIPAGVVVINEGTIFAQYNGLLEISEGGTLINNGSVQISYEGFLNILGTMIGNQPEVTEDSEEYGTGGTVTGMTQAAFKDAISEGGSYTLSDSVYLTEDMTIGQNVDLTVSGSLIVPAGVTLTLNGETTVSYGSLVVQEGGKVICNRPFGVSEGGIVTVNGTMDCYDRLTLYWDGHMTADTLNLYNALIMSYDSTLDVTGQLNLKKLSPESEPIRSELFDDAQLTIADGASLHLEQDIDNYTASIRILGSVATDSTGYIYNWLENNEVGSVEGCPVEMVSVYGFLYDTESFLALLDAFNSGKYCWGSANIRSDISIEEDLTIPKNFYIELPNSYEGETASLTVYEDAVLTLEGIISLAPGGTLNNYGTVEVKSEFVMGGCSIYNEGTILVHTSAILDCFDSVSYEQNPMLVLCDQGGAVASTINVDPEMLTLYAPQCVNQWNMTTAFSRYSTGDYGTVLLEVTEDITLEETLMIVDGATVKLNGGFPWDDQEICALSGDSVSFTVPAGLALINDGILEIGSGASLTVAGEMENRNTLAIAENGLLDLTGCEAMENYGTMVIHGSLAQENTVINNYGGSITVAENSLNVAEGKLVNHLTGGSVGTVEGYPEDALYLSCVPTSADDIRNLIAEYQAGYYAGCQILVDTEFVLSESITLPEGVRMIVSGDAAVLRLENDVLLTVEQGAELIVEDGSIVENNHYLDILGRLTVRDGGMVHNNLDIICGVYATITAEAGSITGNGGVVCFYSPTDGCGSITGVEPQKIYLMCETISSEDELLAMLDFLADTGYVCGSIPIHQNITLTRELVIPEGSAIFLQSDSEDNPITFTVSETAQVINHGQFFAQENATLDIFGRWTGNLPEAEYGGVIHNMPMTEEAFLALLAEAAETGYTADLSQTVILSKDLVLRENLCILPGGRLIVPAGVRLTNAFILNINGDLILDDGAEFVNDGVLFAYNGGHVRAADGTYLSQPAGGSFYANCDSEDSVTGIGPEYITLYRECDTYDQLLMALNDAAENGYPWSQLFLRQDMTIESEELVIPENTAICAMPLMQYGGRYTPITITVPETTTVINNGTFQVGMYATLLVDGQWRGNMPDNTDGTLGGDFFTVTEEELGEMLALGYGAIPGDLTITADTTIPAGCIIEVVGIGQLVIAPEATLTVDGQLVLKDDASLIAEGTLYNNSRIIVQDNAVLNAEGTSALSLSTEDDSEASHYVHGRKAVLEAVYWGNGLTSTSPVLMGIPTFTASVVVTGSNEAFIREMVARVAQEPGIPRKLEILVEEDLTLTDSLQLPIYTILSITNANLTVPSGMTLNNNGQTLIYANAKLDVDGNMTGNLPRLEADTAEFEFDNSGISYSQETLEAQLSASDVSGEAVFLSLPLTLTKDLIIPAGAVLNISGAGITVPADRALINYGRIILDRKASITVENGGILENHNTITLQNGGTLDIAAGEYIHNPIANLYLMDADSVIEGDVADYVTHVSMAADEYDLRNALEQADGQYLEIRLSGDTVLSEDLVLPDFVYLKIEDGSLTIPEDYTLTNNGSIEVGYLGKLTVEEGGMLIGSLPIVSSGEYVNNSIRDQSYLEDLMASGASVMLDTSVLVTGELIVDADKTLALTDEGVYLILADGAKLIVNGTIDCVFGGGIIAQGGTLDNRGWIQVAQGGILDMTDGTYLSEGRNVSLDVLCDEYGDVSSGNVLGVPMSGISPTVGTYASDEIVRYMIDLVSGLIEQGEVTVEPFDTLLYIRFAGDTTLSADLELPAWASATVMHEASLTVPAGVALTDHNGMGVYGTLTAEGQVISTDWPMMAAYQDCLVYPENCTNFYYNDLPVEDITVTPSSHIAYTDQYIELELTGWTPEHANFHGNFDVSFDPEGFDCYGWNEDGNLIVYTSEELGPCTVTVTITAVDYKNSPLMNSQGEPIFQTVTLQFVEPDLEVWADRAPDFFDYGEFGIYAGNSLSFFALLNGDDTEYSTGVTWEYSELSPEIGSVVERDDGTVTITAAEGLTTHETVMLTARHPENADLSYSTLIHLRPRATAADIVLNETIVTGDTVFFDMKRDGNTVQLSCLTDPIGAACVDGFNSKTGKPLLQWTSSSKALATVDEYGNVTFLKPGRVIITMTANFGSARPLTAKVTFNVVSLAQEIVSKSTNVTEMIGGTGANYTVYDPTDPKQTALRSNAVKWFLCDKDGNPLASHPYATLTAAGRLTTKAVLDETKVYLMAQVIGDESSACLAEPIRVTLYPDISSVQILDELSNVITGQTLTHDLLKDGDFFFLDSAVAPYANAVKSLVWGPVRNNFATIDPENGAVTVAKPGTVRFSLTATALNNRRTVANVTMKFGIFTQDLALTALLPGAAEPTADLSGITVYGGEAITFTAANVNADGGNSVTTTGVTWALSDRTCGAIAANGVLRTKAVNNPMTVTVTVTSRDGNCSRQFPVTILPKPVSTQNGRMDALVIRNSHTYITKTTQTIGATEGFTAYAVDARTGAPVDVTWTSSRPQFATIGSTDGVISPVNKGTTTITATDSFGRTATFTLTVNRRSESVSITVRNNAAPIVASGKILTLTGTVTYSNKTTDRNVLWSMTDEAGNPVPKTVATIANGNLTAARGLTSAATVIVTAQAKDGNPDAKAALAVTILPAATGVEIYGPFGAGRDTDITNTTQMINLTDDNTLQLKATVYPYFGSQAPMNAQNALQGVTWTSSNARIAKVDPDTGKVTCLKGGTAVITATAKDGSAKRATFKLTVYKTVDILTLPETAFVGGTRSLNLTRTDGYSIDPDATNKKLIWSMVLADAEGNPKTDLFGNEMAVPTTLATLNNGSLVTRKVTEPQYLLVRAVAADGGNAQAECFVRIYPLTTGVTLYQPDKVTKVPATVIKLPVNHSYTVLPDTNNVAGYGTADDLTADEFMSAGDVWEVTLSNKTIATATFDGRALTVKAMEGIAAPINKTVRVTVKARDGSARSAVFTIMFVEADS